ncbi:MAG: TonB-dependent receptor [Chlorobi bacterium]|nr:TonB-dependent receptor [Chlorobiota bacterium]
MLRKTLLVSFALLFSLGIFAQTGALKGKISDDATGEPIPFANVVVELNGNQMGGGISDFDGNYTIKPIPAGKYTVKASFVGYTHLEMTGVVIKADKFTFVDLKMTASTQEIEEVKVIGYKVPLIDKDNTQTGGTVTSEEIAKMSGRSAESVASTVGGVYTEDGEIKSVRGAREEATVYYIDGVKVRGSNNIPKAAIEQVTMVTGGLAAKYGDATGGIVSITTKGPSKTLFGGMEVYTSHLLDPYSDNLFGFNLSGPMFSKKVPDYNDSTKIVKKPVAGFFISTEFTYVKDDNPSAIGNWKVKDDMYDSIVQNPIIGSSTGLVTTQTADYLQKDAFEKIKYRQNVGKYGVNMAAKFDFQPTKNINITLGGNLDYSNRHDYTFSRGNMNFDPAGNRGWQNALFNSENNPQRIRTTWRTFLRFTQKFNSNASEESNSIIKNVYYSIQADYSKDLGLQQDDTHKDRLFQYGYVGKFTTHKINSYTINYLVDTVAQNAGLPYYGRLHNGFKDTLVEFEASDINPEIAWYTKRYYELYDNNFYGQYANFVNIENAGGILNGQAPPSIYQLFSAPGEQYDGYFKWDNTQFRISASGAADIKNHELSVGFEFEQREDRWYSVSPVGLWTLARDLMNNHILELDYSKPNPVYDAAGVFQDTISYDRLYNGNAQSLFDVRFRKHLIETGQLDESETLESTTWIDIDSYDVSNFSVDYFSADELFNSGNSYVNYYGYDHHGKKIKGTPSFEDFFTETFTDEVGNVRYSRKKAPFMPNYVAAYVQDKFAFNDLIFNVGLRVDRFDANQMVLKDPFLLYESKTAGQIKDPNSAYYLGKIPENIGDDYVVYVDNSESPTKIKGFRNDMVWYDATGAEINDPSIINAATGNVAPYLENPGQALNASAFKDYEPQVTVMPRISFSFPISDVALFFAHYDVLSKRPTNQVIMNPIDYLFIYTRGSNFINNPNLKPEKTIDYELGFQQKLTNSSSLKLSAFYREMRNMTQVIVMNGAYPIKYFTYGNIDFGTVKGITITFDLRRTGNISLRAAYTLQFANGTGSDPNTARNLLRTDQPNLRTLLPFNFDQRHAITIVADYRFGDGKAYNGPKWFGMDILANTGVNFIVNSGSGTPYSKREQQSNYLIGSINGSTKPWRTTINMRLDKDIMLNWGKGDDANKKSGYLTVYLDVSNLLNTINIRDVFETTGNPDDDGYLNFSGYQSIIGDQIDETAYRNYYTMAMNAPQRYSLPRRMQLGIQLNF